jgi:hypothetical protein
MGYRDFLIWYRGRVALEHQKLSLVRNRRRLYWDLVNHTEVAQKELNAMPNRY